MGMVWIVTNCSFFLLYPPLGGVWGILKPGRWSHHRVDWWWWCMRDITFSFKTPVPLSYFSEAEAEVLSVMPEIRNVSISLRFMLFGGEMNIELISTHPMLMGSHVSLSTKHFWSFTAKQHCSILLNNWNSLKSFISDQRCVSTVHVSNCRRCAVANKVN